MPLWRRAPPGIAATRGTQGRWRPIVADFVGRLPSHGFRGLQALLETSPTGRPEIAAAPPGRGAVRRSWWAGPARTSGSVPTAAGRLRPPTKQPLPAGRLLH